MQFCFTPGKFHFLVCRHKHPQLFREISMAVQTSMEGLGTWQTSEIVSQSWFRLGSFNRARQQGAGLRISVLISKPPTLDDFQSSRAALVVSTYGKIVNLVNVRFAPSLRSYRDHPILCKNECTRLKKSCIFRRLPSIDLARTTRILKPLTIQLDDIN